MDEIKTYFGKNLKKLRKIRGYSQEILAEKIGINRRQLTRIETGKSFPSFITLDKICEALNITPSSLFDFSDLHEVLKNGTDNELCYVAQMRRNNVIVLSERVNQNNKKEISNSKDIKLDGEESIINMAKKLKRNILVEYYKDNKVFRSVLYNTDGTFTVKSMTNKDETLIKNINENLKKYCNNTQKLEFIKLAIDCLKSKKSVEKMQNVLNGMLLTIE